MVILGLLSWTGLARLVRGQILLAREQEYVTAAKAMGLRESASHSVISCRTLSRSSSSR